MLVLTRKQQQQIQIGEGVTITILKVKGNTVRIGIEAPSDVKIVRSELTPEEESAPAEEPNSASGQRQLNQLEGTASVAGPGSAEEERYRVLSFRVKADSADHGRNDSPRAASMRDFLAMRSANSAR